MDAGVLQQLINWIVLGSIYSLIAIGFSLLFGVLNVIHFSHGDVSMLAPFFALAAIMMILEAFPSLNPVLTFGIAVLVAIGLVSVVGLVVERVVIRPFGDAPIMMPLVATVALGIVLRELIRHLFPRGSNPHAFNSPMDGHAIVVNGVNITGTVLLQLGLTVGLLAALYQFLNHTSLGVRIRAVSQDREAARLMGIKPEQIFRVTFVLASATGAIAGLFYVSYVGAVRFDFGIYIGLMGFSAAVVGGLGSILGAAVGGMLIAAVEVLAQAAITDGTAYKLVAVFVVVVLFLLFKPEGLLGRASVEKV